MPENGSDAELGREFDRQVENLLRKGYPELAGLPEGVFLRHLAPLKERLPEPPTSREQGRIPFVIVVSLVPADKVISLVELDGKRGFTQMEADDLKRFTPVAGVQVPPGAAYLVADLDTGGGTLDVTPDEAIKTIARENRSPLTIDEGVALVTHYPEVLKTRNCFSLLGSRCGDRRVTAIWISGGSPRLSWCWAGNPHTWLGSASCGSRAGG
ncbi:DUF5701 family protein [Carbonactinospora thermoautotrophica]|uniref:DUF5701 family protein n=1 Tax=Carbonactinospora thermoautotrophica TaxID=1469144 RepID=UPI00226FC779|nr:DUF5701 family protein [Carbonactinospora thermoautotrophica]